VVEKVEAERTKVEEGRNQSPILWHRQHVSQYYGSVTYLALEEDCANTVEELERRNDAALDQHTCTQRCRHPPSRAYRHLIAREGILPSCRPRLQVRLPWCGGDYGVVVSVGDVVVGGQVEWW
jgi:hypothetical protein